MKYSAVAGRYARALLNVAIDQGKEDLYEKLLLLSMEIYNSLRDFFDDPTISAYKKHKKMMEFLEAAGVDKPFENFLQIVFERKRQKYLPMILMIYRDMKIESKGKIPVEVYTPIKLSKEEEEKLAKFVKKHSLRDPVFREHISEDLIAGVRLEFQGMSYDISVKGRLSKIAREIFGKG